MSWKLYEGDCLEVMPTLPDDSFNLIILDPPYNINKAEWDKIGTHEEYLTFIEKVILECERLLMDNGSLYLWHNQFPVLSDFQWLIKDKTDLVFKNLIVWNKFYPEIAFNGGYGNYLGASDLRNYPKKAEYCLFYTFQDETGLTKIYGNDNCFKPIRQYLQEEKEKAGLKTCKQINQLLEVDDSGGGMASHYFSKKEGFKQWALPTKEMYLKLQSTGYFQREYEDLRREYEDLRYTFNNQKSHHSVWNYEIESGKHPTQKPIPLSENIIKHSSNVNDNILIPFAGSGSEMIAATNLNRNVVGIEQNPQYCQLIKERLNETLSQT